MSNPTNYGFDSAFIKGVQDKLTGNPPDPPAGGPAVQGAYQAGRETATKSTGGSK